MATMAQSNIVLNVRAALDRGDFASAEAQLKAERARAGATPEVIEGVSWLGRGALSAKQYDMAEKFAIEARHLSDAALKRRKLDAEPHLPLALSASIEVQAQVMNARGDRVQAVDFLRRELAAFHDTSIAARIQKNINLLTLEGKPAPALEEGHWLGEKPVPLDRLRGHPVLLFFWAHWCADCKAEVSVIQRLNADYKGRGLVVIGPTQHYGYVAGGAEAPPEEESKYIEQVRAKYYARIGPMPVPVSERNFRNYGASTSPTLVLIDKHGTVRLYNPGKLSYEVLASKIEPLL